MHTIGAYLQDKSVALVVHAQNGARALVGGAVAGVGGGFRAHHRRLREETGQTAVEYAGILLLIALVIGAVFMLHLNQKIQAWGQDAINSIGDHCSEAAKEGCKTKD
jgi:Flp pilus assembly pilin Flp